jgi:Insertion element 4 transposase N-terminal
VVVYYVLAMCLFSQVGYEEVARLLTEGLAWARRWRGSWQVPTTGAIAQARARLGAEPLQALFRVAVRPLATPATEGAWYRDWRLAAGVAAAHSRATSARTRSGPWVDALYLDGWLEFRSLGHIRRCPGRTSVRGHMPSPYAQAVVPFRADQAS